MLNQHPRWSSALAGLLCGVLELVVHRTVLHDAAWSTLWFKTIWLPFEVNADVLLLLTAPAAGLASQTVATTAADICIAGFAYSLPALLGVTKRWSVPLLTYGAGLPDRFYLSALVELGTSLLAAAIFLVAGLGVWRLRPCAVRRD